MMLASLNLLVPATEDQKELLLTRTFYTLAEDWIFNVLLTTGEVLEIGALLSIRSQDVFGFERYMAQLKTFYRVVYEYMPESPRMFMLLGILVGK